ncbi:uncharacterized protein I303_105837 [Kwoniella dejecticola CBS 10117]|uniref:Sec20 C-terminal domain-containing protein n=1 Tax=Kwoniella dejecticola CBS 10117 TaxID=1296121 RepID=A0A1A6A0L2_9TREE|nr:uncharacterized protein I303_05858 [Kwoniella dejecticola CBS 10117]OBR83578.1 hypothetical protein I303_05858 [Kwoniella dejecticola CBS 10117]
MDTLNSILGSLPRRLNDLETFQLPRLQSCLGPLDLHKELVEEMRSDLEVIHYNIEIAKEMSHSIIFSIEDEQEREEVSGRIRIVEDRYTSLKRSFRQAMLDSKRNILSRRSRVHELSEKSKSRYELDESRLQGDLDKNWSASGTRGKGKAMSAAEFGMGGDDELQTKTNEVTTALRRTTALMQTELEKSVLSIQTLESSTQTLLSTSGLYDRYTSLLSTASQITKAIEKADFLDRIIIFAAFGFFLLVVAFIIKRRVLDRTVGVVIGGVGKGVGWYAFKSTKLIKRAFVGAPTLSSEKQLLKFNAQDVDPDQILIRDPSIQQDSAIGGKIPQTDIADTPDPTPGSQPTQPFDLSGRDVDGKGKCQSQGGTVEIIPNDQGDRIKASWAKDEL